MEGSRETPERTPVNDGDEGTDDSSPLKPLSGPVAGHNAEEVAERTMPTTLQDVSVERMYKLLGRSMEDMNKAFSTFPKMRLLSKSSFDENNVTEYLDRLSDIVHKYLKKPLGVIRFFNRNHNAPKDHPTGITNRPDFLALKVPVEQASPSQFYWSALEATGELLSGTDKEASHTESAAYMSYLLQARPDMVTVQGIYVDTRHFRLAVSSACGAFRTGDLEWEPRLSHVLLCTWILRLYEPLVDSSITVNIEGNKAPTFNIELPEANYLNCTIRSAGTTFGRRTIIFACPDPEVVIKEQYIETSRRFEEGRILTKIHKNGTFPGVVRRGWSGPVRSSEKELIVEWEGRQRKKTRVVLLDKAPSIMDAKTLREVLVAMYDLLEITRFLQKNRGILHRDISCNNVLLRPVVPPAQSSADNDQSITEQFREMCFASYLLRTKSNSSNSPSKLDTRVLLIDFDMSQDQAAAKRKKALHEQTGTPIFVARAVVSCRQKEGVYRLMPMPQFDQANEAYEAYVAAVPDRLDAFPANKKELFDIPSDIRHIPFKHELQYNAESVFWLLLWWAIQAYPAGTSPDDNKIDDRHWDALTMKQDADLDPRERFVNQSLDNVLHPFYKSLETLLEDMAQQLRGDHEKGEVQLKQQNSNHKEDQSRKRPDYLHEAFQRLIIKFLFANYNEEFMTVEKGPKFRKHMVMAPRVTDLSSAQVSKVRASRGKTGASGGSSSLNVGSSYNLRAAPPSTPSDSSGNRKRKGTDEDANSPNSNDGDPSDPDWIPRPAQRRHK